MKSLLLIARISFSATAVLCLNANAAEECSRALVPDISVIKNDVASRTAFLSIIDEESYKSLRNDAGLSAEFLAFDIPFGADAEYSEFSQGRERHFEKTKYSTSYKNASGYLLQTLSPGAFKAYTSCLQLKALQAEGPHIVPIAVSASLLTVKLIWRSPSGLASSKVSYDSSGLEKESIAKLPKTVPSNADIDLILSGVENQETRLAVTIAGKGDSIVIPLPPPVVSPPPELGPKEIYMAPQYTTEGDGRRTKNLTCPNGYHVIPGSGRCSSTSVASGKLVENRMVGKMSWFCQWENYSDIGIGLKIEMACERD